MLLLALKGVLYSRKTFAEILTVAALVALIFSTVSSFNGYREQVQEMLQPYSLTPELLVTKRGVNELFSGLINYSAVKDLHVTKVRFVLPVLLTNLKVKFRNGVREVRVEGVDPYVFASFKPIKVKGVLVEDGLKCNVGSLLSEEVGVVVGENLSFLLNNEVVNLTVAGIIYTNGPCDWEIILPLKTLWFLKPNLKEKVSFFEVSLSNARFEKETVKEIEGRNPCLKAQPIRKTNLVTSLLLKQFEEVVTIWIYIVYLMVSISIYAVSSNIVAETERDVSVFKVLGMKRREVIKTLFYKVLIVSVTGYMLGLSIGLVGAQVVSRIIYFMKGMQVNPFIEPWQVFQSLIAVLLISSAASLFSTYKTLKVKIKEVANIPGRF